MTGPNDERRDSLEADGHERKGTLIRVIVGVALILAGIAGVVIGLKMLKYDYREMEIGGRCLLMLAIAIGFSGIYCVVPFRIPLIMYLWPVLLIAFAAVDFHANFRQPVSRYSYLCKENLSQLGKAINAYSQNWGGYVPYDERGPLHSLALLYPDYMGTAECFSCYNARTSWAKRNAGTFFPADTPLAGNKCYYGYTWKCGIDPAADLAIMADMPENHRTNERSGFNVLYADGAVRWQESPFCSHDPNDNIFAREPGWSADTDSWIRVE